MELLLKIKDSKAAAFLQVINDLPYVKTEVIIPAKKQFLKELKEAVDELNQVKAGKRKARNAEIFLNEL